MYTGPDVWLTILLLTWANHPNPTPDPKPAHQRALSYTSALFSVSIWCWFENHIKLITASGKLDCLVSRLQKCICVCKHYKMTGCSMQSQSCLIMTEWGLILPLRSRHSKLPPTCTPCWQTQRKKLETWQRMRTRTHTPSTLPGLFPYGLAIHATLCWRDRGAYWMPQYELWISHSLPPPLMVTQRPN